MPLLEPVGMSGPSRLRAETDSDISHVLFTPVRPVGEAIYF